MKCECGREFSNKKSFSNHRRWEKGIMSKESYRGINFAGKNKSWRGGTRKGYYQSTHDWIRRWFGQPNKCEECGTEIAKAYDWANISNEYKRDIKDWKRLCRSCHRRYDIQKNIKNKMYV